MNVLSYFKQRNELKDKINFLIRYHHLEHYSVFLGLSYIQYCKNITHSNLYNYTLCAIMLANKYLNDYNYNIVDITSSVDIQMKDYIKIEIEILTCLNWNLSTLDNEIIDKYRKLIKGW